MHCHRNAQDPPTKADSRRNLSSWGTTRSPTTARLRRNGTIRKSARAPKRAPWRSPAVRRCAAALQRQAEYRTAQCAKGRAAPFAIDTVVKRNIRPIRSDRGCTVTLAPQTWSVEEILPPALVCSAKTQSVSAGFGFDLSFRKCAALRGADIVANPRGDAARL